MKNFKLWCGLLGMMLGSVTLPVVADAEPDALAARIAAQQRSAGRNQYDALKDAGRKPLATTRFFGLAAGMTVLDVNAGGGYSSEILSAAVGPEGTVYAHNGHFILRLIDGAHHAAMLERLQNGRLPNVRYMMVDVEDLPFDNSVDLAQWGFNMHDVYHADGSAGVLVYLASLHRALKPGGILAISEHVGSAGQDNAELHRLEPAIVSALVEQAGFVIEASSDLLANPADDHSHSVYADGLRYHTDRLLLRARKPR